jgi:DNA-directed RNA polymerase subunit alpha
MINLNFTVKTIKKDPKRSLFEVEPLYPGYGVTIGNALRRILLSSIEGAAITKAKIKGATSEFTNMQGIKEDTLELILNLKQVRLKLSGDEPQKLELKVSGEKEVKASDIKTSPQVEIINKDLHIATLTKKDSKLEIELTVERGLGYVLAENLRKGKPEVGAIYLDAIFTPVQKVGFAIESIMFEERTDYNKLKMDVETDGTIDPEKAMEKAIDVLINHMNSVKESFMGPKTKPKVAEKAVKEDKSEEGPQEESSTTIEDLKLPTRTINALKDNGIKSLDGLLRRKEESLKEMKGLGDKAIEDIIKKLKKKGLELK